jgi:hypothetical protein
MGDLRPPPDHFLPRLDHPMNTTQLTRCRRLFGNDLAPRHVIRHNQRQWVRSIRQLGNKWLLAQPVAKELS